MENEKNLKLDLEKLYQKKNSENIDFDEIEFDEHINLNFNKNESENIYKKNYPLIDNIFNDFKNTKKNKWNPILKKKLLINNLNELFLGNYINFKFCDMNKIDTRIIFNIINKKMKRKKLFFRETEFNYINFLNSIGRFKNVNYIENNQEIFKFVFINFLKTLKIEKNTKLSLNEKMIYLFGKDSKIDKNTIFINKKKLVTFDFNFLKKTKNFILFKNKFSFF